MLKIGDIAHLRDLRRKPITKASQLLRNFERQLTEEIEFVRCVHTSTPSQKNHLSPPLHPKHGQYLQKRISRGTGEAREEVRETTSLTCSILLSVYVVPCVRTGRLHPCKAEVSFLVKKN